MSQSKVLDESTQSHKSTRWVLVLDESKFTQ